MEIKNFAIIQGSSLTINDGKISFDPARLKLNIQENNPILIGKEGDIEYNVLRSDSTFGNGLLEFIFKIESYRSGIILKLMSYDNIEVSCGYSVTNNTFLIAVKDGSNWKILSKAGNLSNFNLKEVIKFRVEINGSQINLFINNISFCSANLSVKEMPIEFRVSSDKSFEVYGINKISRKPKIFVVMQFSSEYNELFEEVIKPVVEKYGYDCIRADEYYTGTPILSDIVKSIEEATAIIAEMTPDNPNVFYEIGYSHAIGKPTILLCDKKREKMPFDLSSFRTLFYENTIAGKKRVENSLVKYLENI